MVGFLNLSAAHPNQQFHYLMGQRGMVYYKPTIPIIVRRVFMATFKKSLWQRAFGKGIVDEVQLVLVYVLPFIPD